MKISVTQNVSKALEDLKKDLKDSQERLTEMNIVVAEQIKQNFQNKSSTEGEPWKPATPASQKQGHMGDLRGTGKLFNAFKKGLQSPKQLVFKSNLPYDAVHQFGSKQKNIPARPYLPLTKDGQLLDRTIEEILKRLNKRFDTIIKNAESKFSRK